MKEKALSSILALVLGALGVSLPAAAFAAPCDTLVCMAGKAAGQSGGNNCDQPIKDFFAIQRHHHGHLDLGPTSDARRQYLNQCPDKQQANAANIDQIIERFGTVE
ncbi:TrbM/KikA/MpfK family conjugal transfer protein [Pandoraea oxalativorans]|uniref:Killer protein n=1 Tax=Pandoraea oxalativorans TaxID=573737 RepID=A0A0G3IEX6_9BURK|nr:TrbM/KikA/MpfK family conjugal transfer protein [Pandoraea oxalativorans]AKK25113.1 hypothetical protein MB84_30805 [Pandoraea oxalativorans]